MMQTTNNDRFQVDLDRLLEVGDGLQFAMIIGAHGKANGQKLLKEAGFNEDVIENAVKEQHSFSVLYQAWYTESLAVIRQLIPDRVVDFRALYERPSNRKDISFITYVISDFLIGLKSTRGGDVVADAKSAIPKFQTQLAILDAAKSRLTSSLFDIRQLVQADLFDSELEAARELLKNRFVRAAGAMAGVVLERHLKQVCETRSLRIGKKHPGISDFNDALKASAVIETPQWRSITLLSDYRNLCDHSKDKDPTVEQVSDLISGTDKIIKTVV